MSKINVRDIQLSIARENLGWEAASNEYTALSEEDRQYLLGFVPGPHEKSLAAREEAALRSFRAFKLSAAGKGIRKPKAYGYPTSFDWRNANGANYVTAIKNQNPCGSCVAFGVIATAETAFRIQRGSASLAVDFSEAQLFYCYARSEGRNCQNGWWPENALKAFRDKGLVDEACFPYTPVNQPCNTCSDAANRALKISGYTNLTNPAAMKEWLSTRGPLVGCFTVYTDFFSYRSGVYRRANNHVEGGHCVCVVGYDDVLQCWICKNSWGPGWGDGGYFRIGYGQCGIDSSMQGVNSIVETYWTGAQKVIGLWSNDAPNNAWAFIQNFGWRKISNASDNIHLNLLTQCISAKNRGTAVSIHLTNGLIDEIYN
ncbi:C1 family peptidase [Niabella drilacis]|uniref:Papain family cysteine protease n=1 Tax=Niabella drilacis (strain DSM 25811 / CCM 8410 / CCUG 62505 / LMG 26954 / E90) TaxID=1285928 RepID=A0A1G6Q036_NIADE|nr:C1 family peptidase [Niabella drilacis]SDC85581.1 Papain family cysteine protease [Niabella drilacis]